MRVEIPKAFEPLFQPSRYKAFYGGRGGAKSHAFASALCVKATERPLKILCGREIQKSIKESVKALIELKIHQSGMGDLFRVLDSEIRGTNGALISFAGLKSNPDSIKSMEGIDIFWGEEANRISQRSLDLVIPTVRAEGSELWFSWNPESDLDPVDVRFRGPRPPPSSIVRRVTFRDNPFFPSVLEAERLHDLATDPEKHEHVWEGGYKQAPHGSYYAKLLSIAVTEGRITSVPHDPAAQVHVAWDLGLGRHMALWFAQIVGREIHVIEYLEGDEDAANEGIPWFTRHLKSRPYTYAPQLLPHDAKARETGTGKSRQEMLESLGFRVKIVPRLSVEDGIEAVRALLPRCYFDAGTCQDGLRPLREYHERWDEKRRVSLGPEDDWAAHAADAFRYLAVGLKEDRPGLVQAIRKPRIVLPGQQSGAWMGV